MRAVVQRVKNAKVVVDNKTVASIGKGLVVFIGIGQDDNEGDIQYMVRKILGLRVFEDSNGKMNLSVMDVDGDVLLVSQFTLYGDVRRGKRPSFSSAMSPEDAGPFFEKTVEFFKKEWKRIQTGVFQAMMDVHLVNDGPVTILLDSKKLF